MGREECASIELLAQPAVFRHAIRYVGSISRRKQVVKLILRDLRVTETIPKRLRHLDDIVISACPGNPRIDYRSCRQDLLLHLETAVQQEKAWIDGLSNGFDKKDAQENLCRAMTRIAQTLRNPELIHLAEKLRDEFFGLSDVLKKYNVDDPDQVDSDMWPRYVPVYSHDLRARTLILLAALQLVHDSST